MDVVIKMKTKPIVMRSAKSTYIVFTLMWLIPLFISLFAILKQPLDKSLWLMGLIVIACGITATLWVYKFKIEIKEGVIKYETLFGGVKAAKLSDIESATVKVGVHEYMDRFLPTIRLEIKMKPNSSNFKNMIINLKVFSKSDVNDLTKAVNAKGASHD